jgi:bifunctional non-homologous end joining protein LigD
MLLLRTDRLPEGDGWLYEVKFDGYRALAIKSGGAVRLRSRNDKDFTGRYPGVVAALRVLPDETVIDGELAALDAAGKPVFSLLQNGGTNVHFYAFDVLMLGGKDVTGEPFVRRRALLENHVLPKLSEPVRCSPVLQGQLVRPGSVHQSAGPGRTGRQAR